MIKVKNFNKSAKIIAIIVISIIIVKIFGLINVYFDFTNDKRYTLSEGTKNVLKDLKLPVSIRYYVSGSGSSLPLFLRNKSKRIDDLLLEYKRKNSSKISIDKLDPAPDTEQEDSAMLDGISPAQIPGEDPLYMGIVITCFDKKITLPSLLNKTEETFEYELTRGIIHVTRDTKTKIAFKSEMQLAGMPFGPQSTPAWIFYQQLGKDFELSFESVKVQKIQPETDAIVLFHPYDISEETMYEVDQFLLAGGNVITVVDPDLFSSRFLQPQQGGGIMGMRRPPEGGPKKSSNLQKLFTAWGLKYDENKILADSANKTNLGQFETPTIITLGPESFSKQDIISKELNNMLLIQSGFFELDKKEGLEYSPLIFSSKFSQPISKTEAIVDPKSVASLNNNLKPTGIQYPIAVKITGNFKSAFPDGLKIKKDEKSKDKNPKPAKHLSKSKKEGIVLAIADVDFLYNQFTVQEQNVFGQRLMIVTNNNMAFMQNAVELLSGGSDLIKVRSRNSLRKPFTLIKKREKIAQEKYNDTIVELEKEAVNVEQRINELQQQKDKSQEFIITPEQKKELEKFQDKELEIRKKLRELRRDLRKDIDSLKAWIKGINIFLAPIILSIFGLIYYYIRRSQTSAH